MREPISKTTAGAGGGTSSTHDLTDAVGAVLAHPVDDVAVRSEQTQESIVLDRLQRPDPGVEVLFRQLGFEPAEALIPE